VNRRLVSLGWLAILSLILLGTPSVASAQIQVNSTNPNTVPQGTTNLNITVGGNGFKKGAKAQWFVTGTINPGGVTVNSTTFNSSSQLTANITVATNATISGFDVQVTNADGRTGKGTDLFAVVQGSNNANSCTVQPVPSGISWVASLNYVTASGAAAFGTNFGVTTRARQMVLGGVNVLIVGVGTPATTGNLEIFVLNPSTGQVLDGTMIGSNTAVQPHITVNLGAGTSGLAVGDVNGDGIPDFLAGSKDSWTSAVWSLPKST
jgi:FG-GAP-like repeat